MPGVELDNAPKVLASCGWDVKKAVLELKIQEVLKCPIEEWKISEDKSSGHAICKMLLMASQGDLKDAKKRVRRRPWAVEGSAGAVKKAVQESEPSSKEPLSGGSLSTSGKKSVKGAHLKERAAGKSSDSASNSCEKRVAPRKINVEQTCEEVTNEPSLPLGGKRPRTGEDTVGAIKKALQEASEKELLSRGSLNTSSKKSVKGVHLSEKAAPGSDEKTAGKSCENASKQASEKRVARKRNFEQTCEEEVVKEPSLPRGSTSSR